LNWFITGGMLMTYLVSDHSKWFNRTPIDATATYVSLASHSPAPQGFSRKDPVRLGVGDQRGGAPADLSPQPLVALGLAEGGRSGDTDQQRIERAAAVAVPG